MRSLLFSVTVLVTVLLASGSSTDGFRRLSKAESDELNEICGKTLIGQYPRGSVQRISYGTTAMQGELPWAARLMISDGRGLFACSASIISKYHVITAAHCFIRSCNFQSVSSVDIKKSFILGGSSCAYWNSYEQEVCKGDWHEPPRKLHISKIIVPASSLVYKHNTTGGPIRMLTEHDQDGCHSSCTNRPDIAIVELEDPISDMDKQMVPICVPSHSTSPPFRYIQYGFGDTGYRYKNPRLYKLRQNKHQLLNTAEHYAKRHKERLCEKMVAVLHTKGRRHICDGDSGGGLSGTSKRKQYLFGVLSSSDNRACGHFDEDSLSIYTKLVPFNDFLCFYTGVCPLGYDVYVEKNYAEHPEAAFLYSGGSFRSWLNKGKN